MNELLIVLPFYANDMAQAEKLCDWIYHLNGKVKQGHVLLVAAPDVHAEFHTKIKLSAEIAFEGAELIVFKPEDTTGWEKPQWINSMFAYAAAHIAANYRWPWLWLEPDCVPVRRNWMGQLAQAYHSQPKPFAGPILSDGKGQLSLSRVAIYPPNARESLVQYCGSLIPFELMAGPVTVPRSTKLRLIQQMKYTGDDSYPMVRQDAVLVHHDKQGLLLQRLQMQPPITANGVHPLLVVERTAPVFVPPPVLNETRKAVEVMKQILAPVPVLPVKRKPGRPKNVVEGPV